MHNQRDYIKKESKLTNNIKLQPTFTPTFYKPIFIFHLSRLTPSSSPQP